MCLHHNPAHECAAVDSSARGLRRRVKLGSPVESRGGADPDYYRNTKRHHAGLFHDAGLEFDQRHVRIF